MLFYVNSFGSAPKSMRVVLRFRDFEIYLISFHNPVSEEGIYVYFYYYSCSFLSSPRSNSFISFVLYSSTRIFVFFTYSAHDIKKTKKQDYYRQPCKPS